MEGGSVSHLSDDRGSAVIAAAPLLHWTRHPGGMLSSHRAARLAALATAWGYAPRDKPLATLR